MGLFKVLNTIFLIVQVTQIIQEGQKEAIGNLFFSQLKPGSDRNYTINIHNSTVSGMLYLFLFVFIFFNERTPASLGAASRNITERKVHHDGGVRELGRRWSQGWGRGWEDFPIFVCKMMAFRTHAGWNASVGHTLDISRLLQFSC